MDLKNLPSRYTQISNEMDSGSKLPEGVDIGGSKPSTVEVRKEASRPGFLTWKSDDEPLFKVEESVKITGQNFDLDKALQGRYQKDDGQGRAVKEFPNVKPLIVKADSADVEKDDQDDDKELGQWVPSSGLGKLLTLGLVFGLGFFVCRKLKR